MYEFMPQLVHFSIQHVRQCMLVFACARLCACLSRLLHLTLYFTFYFAVFIRNPGTLGSRNL